MDSREDLGLVCKNPDRAHIFFFWTTSRGLLPKLARYRKRFELQQRDCAQTKDLLKQFQDLIRFFKFSLRKADLWGLEGVQIFLSKVVEWRVCDLW